MFSQFYVFDSEGMCWVRKECPTWCSGGQRPLIAGCPSLPRLGMDLPVTKPYPSKFHTYTSKLRPVIGFLGLKHLDEVSNRIPPTPHNRGPLNIPMRVVQGEPLV